MTAISSMINARTIAFVKVELSGLTLRFATENVMAKDTDGLDYFWEGRVLSISDLACGFNDFKNASSTVSNVSITLANGKVSSSDSTLDSYFSTYFWGKKTVTLFLKGADANAVPPSLFRTYGWRVGAGSYAGVGKSTGPSGAVTGGAVDFDLSTTDIVFKGIVGFPDIYTQKEEEISFSAYDARYLDQLYVCPNVFQRGQIENDFTYWELGQGVGGKRVPVIYGDFSSEEIVPAFQISLTALPAQNLKIADSTTLASGQDALTECLTVSIDGNRVATTGTSLTSGYVSISDNSAVDARNITVGCKGKTRGTAIAALFGYTAGSLLEHPVEIIYDMLVNRLGVDSSLVDSTGFTNAAAENSDMKCRRWIGAEESLIEVINDLCFEFGFELYSIFGVFHIKKFSIAGTSKLSVSSDLMGEGSYSIQVDPNRSYLNKLTLSLDIDPSTGQPRKTSVLNVYPKIARHGVTQDYALDLKWAYKEAWAVERFGLLSSQLSGPIKQVSLSLMSGAWELEPTDVFALTFHIFTNESMLTRTVSKSLTALTTNVSAWDLGTSRRKVWAVDAQAAPANYATALSDPYGIWHGSLRIITGLNDTLKMTASSTATVTISAGNYSNITDISSAFATALTAVVGKTIVISYDTATRKFTISTGDASVFTIHWTDTPSIGRTFFGFDVSANDTGASSYTSDYVAIFDYQEGEIVSQWA